MNCDYCTEYNERGPAQKRPWERDDLRLAGDAEVRASSRSAPKAVGQYISQMTAAAAECRSANRAEYRTLLANFDAAYRNMKSCSEGFNNALLEVSAGPPPHEGRSRVDRASMAYEDAREQFQFAVAMLNVFLIGQIVSSHSTVQSAA